MFAEWTALRNDYLDEIFCIEFEIFSEVQHQQRLPEGVFNLTSVKM